MTAAATVDGSVADVDATARDVSAASGSARDDAPVHASRDDAPAHACALCAAPLRPQDFSRRQRRRADDGARVVCKRCNAARHGDARKTPQIVNGNRLASGARVRPNNWGYATYVDEVFGLRCFGDLAQTGALASAKDVSESMAALHAVRRHGGIGWKATGTTCLCVGDGAAPRTGALAAYLTKWDVVSIDPVLGSSWNGAAPAGIRRLEGFRGTFEEYVARPPPPPPPRLVILMVHSHARLVGPCSVAGVRRDYGLPETCLVAIPCCPKVCPAKDVGVKPRVAYRDDCVFSDKRRVEVWRFAAGETGPDRPAGPGQAPGQGWADDAARNE